MVNFFLPEKMVNGKFPVLGSFLNDFVPNSLDKGKYAWLGGSI